MGGRRILTDAQIDEMCALRERGRSARQIARHFADAGVTISASAIDWQCLSHGADAPRQLQGPCTQAVAPYRRGASVVQPYTPAEDARLRHLRGLGLRISEISRRMGRKPNSVRARLLTLARRDARAEEAVEMQDAAE
jgi:DNA-binding CsgD family transcriptional regulator